MSAVAGFKMIVVNMMVDVLGLEVVSSDLELCATFWGILDHFRWFCYEFFGLLKGKDGN